LKEKEIVKSRRTIAEEEEEEEKRRRRRKGNPWERRKTNKQTRN